ncbi:MAG: flagellar biosynthesis protein FlhF [Phycisphaerae bacterium]|nr:flagellar biosynthesis protein FlhF [Phycisphaerae bacterium]
MPNARAMEGIVTIRTYRGKSVAEAIALVKKDLGRQAVILSTRTYKTGGLFGFRARTMTEITASDQAPGRGLPSVPKPKAARKIDVAAPAVFPAASAPAVAEPSLKQVAQMIVAANAKTPIEEELAAIKKMVGQVLRSSSAPTQPGMPEALFECYQRMLESAVASEIASEVAGQVRDELNPAELRDPECVRRSVLRRLAAWIPVCADASKVGREADGRPLTVALVGPTGVGKTTTIAKLAATYRLKQGKRVGLITCDTYRIAAVDQLRTYAGIINIPLKIAMTAAEMRSACGAMSDCDVVLIDTAGRAPRDAARLGELKALIGAACPHQTHLVLSSSAAEASLLDAAERFAPLGCDRVILTKLDEAVSFGVVVNVLKRLNTRLSFVTTGQEVPDHIEAMTPDRFARLVMGAETLAR